MHSSRQADGREWNGGDGSGVEGRAGQGRVPDCLGGLSRVGISSRSTRPWNGQPPSISTTIGATSSQFHEIVTLGLQFDNNHDQIWQARADRSGNGSYLNKLAP